MWKCPKCKRQFKKKNQAHSCVIFPVKNHFINKPKAKELYDEFKRKVEQTVGKFKVDSPRCCIHFVNNYTFAGTYVMKEKLRVFFALDHKIKSRRVKYKPISRSTHEYLIDIETKEDINKELMNWIKQAYEYDKQK